MSKVKSYLSLIKFSHTIFAMPFALIGFVLGLFSTSYHPFIGAWLNKNGVYQWDLNHSLGWAGYEQTLGVGIVSCDLGTAAGIATDKLQRDVLERSWRR